MMNGGFPRKLLQKFYFRQFLLEKLLPQIPGQIHSEISKEKSQGYLSERSLDLLFEIILQILLLIA